jgi:hypothetical protein
VGIGDYPNIYNMLNTLQQGANMGRIPGEAGLENQSSTDIASLLNPGYNFPDVNRQSAELAAGRGVPGSAAAYGTGLRMTDEERLRRIALGENLLSGATARNPSAPLPNVRDFILTPYEQAELALRQQQSGAGGRGGGPSIGYGGGLPSYPPAQTSVSGGYPAVGATSGTMPYDNSSPYILPNPGMTYPNPSAPMLPLYPGAIPSDTAYGPPQWSAGTSDVYGPPTWSPGALDVYGPPISGMGDGSDFNWEDSLNELGIGDVAVPDSAYE